MDEEGEENNSTSDCDSAISVSDSENDRHEDDDGEELCEKNFFFVQVLKNMLNIAGMYVFFEYLTIDATEHCEWILLFSHKTQTI